MRGVGAGMDAKGGVLELVWMALHGRKASEGAYSHRFIWASNGQRIKPDIGCK